MTTFVIVWSTGKDLFGPNLGVFSELTNIHVNEKYDGQYKVKCENMNLK